MPGEDPRPRVPPHQEKARRRNGNEEPTFSKLHSRLRVKSLRVQSRSAPKRQRAMRRLQGHHVECVAAFCIRPNMRYPLSDAHRSNAMPGLESQCHRFDLRGRGCGLGLHCRRFRFRCRTADSGRLLPQSYSVPSIADAASTEPLYLYASKENGPNASTICKSDSLVW